jgi:hypothetical protein
MDQSALSTLIAKEEIRELVLLYSRGVDRKDFALLRSLYTNDATDEHGHFFKGPADKYVDALEQALPHMPYSGHHVCNHLISVDGEEGEGEVYALAVHVIPDGKGGMAEDFEAVRYIDRYRKEEGRWRFAARKVEFDLQIVRPLPTPDKAPRPPEDDPSVTFLTSRLFARGSRA